MQSQRVSRLKKRLHSALVQHQRVVMLAPDVGCVHPASGGIPSPSASGQLYSNVPAPHGLPVPGELDPHPPPPSASPTAIMKAPHDPRMDPSVPASPILVASR